MAVHYTLTLHCGRCGAAITYRDERPAWQTEPPDPETIAEAHQWVAEHRTTPPGFGVLVSAIGAPPYVQGDMLTGQWRAVVPDPRQYVPCPACDAAVYRESGLLPSIPAPEPAPTAA
jgi:hypothetical protein